MTEIFPALGSILPFGFDETMSMAVQCLFIGVIFAAFVTGRVEKRGKGAARGLYMLGFGICIAVWLGLGVMSFIYMKNALVITLGGLMLPVSFATVAYWMAPSKDV